MLGFVFTPFGTTRLSKELVADSGEQVICVIGYPVVAFFIDSDLVLLCRIQRSWATCVWKCCIPLYVYVVSYDIGGDVASNLANGCFSLALAGFCLVVWLRFWCIWLSRLGLIIPRVEQLSYPKFHEWA